MDQVGWLCLYKILDVLRNANLSLYLLHLGWGWKWTPVYRSKKLKFLAGKKKGHLFIKGEQIYMQHRGNNEYQIIKSHIYYSRQMKSFWTSYSSVLGGESCSQQGWAKNLKRALHVPLKVLSDSHRCLHQQVEIRRWIRCNAFIQKRQGFNQNRLTSTKKTWQGN